MEIEAGLNTEEAREAQECLDRQSLVASQPVTLNALMSNWCAFVREVERGYTDSIYEYTNDLSVRDVLDDLSLGVRSTTRAKIIAALSSWDQRFYAATRSISKPLAQSKKNRTWWSRVPLTPHAELESDLRLDGLL